MKLSFNRVNMLLKKALESLVLPKPFCLTKKEKYEYSNFDMLFYFDWLRLLDMSGLLDFPFKDSNEWFFDEWIS